MRSLVTAPRLFTGLDRAPIDQGAVLVEGNRIVAAGREGDIGVLEGPVQRFHVPDGTIVPLEVALPGLCGHCGGRGESWSDPCDSCCGTGECDHPHHVHLAVPARVADGTRFRFVLSSPRARPTRVEVTVSVA